MKSKTFNWEIQTLLEQFIGAFNDIIIRRYDNDKNLLTPPEKKVAYVYGPKTRLFNFLNNSAPGGLKVPVVSVIINSINRDNSRVFNKIEGFDARYSNDLESSPFDKKIPQPVPINIGITMTIVTKFQNDMDQILSNFIPYCDPYVVISWKLPTVDSKFPVELRSEVLWDGSVRLTYPLELAATQPYRISADASFIIKGWLFRRMDEVFNKIYVINSDYSATNFNDDLITSIDDMLTDTFSISAQPQF